MNVFPNPPTLILLKRLVIYVAIFMSIGSSTHTAIGQVYDPGSTVLGKTMTDRLGEWTNWRLSSRDGAHAKDTSGERIYENQQGPIFYLPRGVPTLEVESEVDVPHDAPLWLHFLASSAWEHGEEGNRNIARNNFRFPTDHEVFVRVNTQTGILTRMAECNSQIF